MSKTVIKVENISKRYRLGLKEEKSDTFAGTVANVIKSPWQNFKRLRSLSKFDVDDDSVFWALKDISFEVKEGEVLGIIGKNGAGKSTLLKILSQITEPTSGQIEITGRVASLLEVGTGFHPELTGRENIYMNGTILGMTKKEIDRKLDEIVDFSGVEKFIDTTVKFYSSGMKVRLGFSVAAHLEPEILIIDEVLAVGDYEFQKKCLGKMEDVASHGRTVLFVSHNMSAVENLCDSGLLLTNGTIAHFGQIEKTVNFYLKNVNELLLKNNWKVDQQDYSKSLELIEAKIDLLGEQPNLKLEIKSRFVSNNDHKKAFVAYDVLTDDNTPIFQSIPTDTPFINESKNGQVVTVIIDLPPLIPGLYKISIWIGSHYTETYDWQQAILSFNVETSPMRNRTLPHSKKNGFIVPNSYLVD